MNNCINADIRRVFHKQSFWGALGVFGILFAVIIFIYYNTAFTADLYVAKITSFLSFFPLAVGLFIFMSVYADNFKSRSMQVAIGYGISRRKIVLAELLESTILLFCTAAVISVFVMGAPLILGLAPDARHFAMLFFTILAETLRALGYIAISAILVFFFQNGVNGIIVYVLLASKTVYIVLSMILGQEFLVNMTGDLMKYIYTTQLYTVKTLLMENEAFYSTLISALICYVMIPTVISIMCFNRKELEF